MKRIHAWSGVTAAAALLAMAAGYWAGSGQGLHDTRAVADLTGGAPTEGRRVLYWYDPMEPQQRFDRPGKSPFMDMELIPKYADEGEDAASIRIDPALTQNLGLRLVTVESGRLAETLEAPATVKFNERDVTIVQARSAGFVERAYGRAPGDLVKRGAPIVDLLISDWAGAQIEFIALLNTGDASLVSAARERLVLLGMSHELIRAIEQSRKPRLALTVRSPADGVITSVGVREGMSVMAGQMLAEINGFTPIWLEAQVPEADAQILRRGQTAFAEFPAFPGKTLRGTVTLVLPEVNQDARTARVRIELPNPDGILRAGLYARVRIEAGDGAELPLLPSEAVIRTGTRTAVMVAEQEGRYRPVLVKLGRESNGRIEVIEGVRPGQHVVASGQFLIDSEANIRGVLARAGEADSAARPTALHQGEGTVESIESGEITLSHGPIPALKWGAMTMLFRLQGPGTAAGIEPGDRVHFAFRQYDDGFTVESLTKNGTSP